MAGFFPGLKAAVASGSLSVFDGVKIAQVFTPLMLQAAGAQSTDESFARSVASYLDESVRQKPLVGEPYHVVAVKAQNPDALAVVLDGMRAAFPLTDVELHKTYAPTRANLYVRSGAKPEFDAFAASFTDATTWELKEPSVNDQAVGAASKVGTPRSYRRTAIRQSMGVEGQWRWRVDGGGGSRGSPQALTCPQGVTRFGHRLYRLHELMFELIRVRVRVRCLRGRRSR
ncbi:hypothetical protein [Streptomyces sp. NPDC059468]|uniref:hypothetical protein n=1 Tax=Streptomyces sp. NPDC059468 TaxID=3346845 RepID=UPI003684109E